jgi:hypothetical protein
MTMFRIGGVYRDSEGRLYRLLPMDQNKGGLRLKPCAAPAKAANVSKRSDKDIGFSGYRSLVDGADLADYPHDGGNRNLIPGELTLVNGEWVSMTPTLDKMEAEKRAAEAYFSFNVGDVIPAPASVDLDLTRPALDWNKPASHDRFPGFTTTSHTQDKQASPTHAVQRCADFDGLVMKAR